MVEQGLKSRLGSDATLTTMVGTRIFPQVAPQNSPFPRITYQRAASARRKTFDGIEGWVEASIRVDCWSKDYKEVKNVANRVRLLVDGFKGVWSGFVIGLAKLEGEQELYEPSVVADEAGIHRVSFDLTVWFDEQ